MSRAAGFYAWRGADLLLFCQLQPQAGRSEFADVIASADGDNQCGARLKIRIAAAPIDGKANAQLIAFLADQFGVTKQAVRILSGTSGRHKSVLIERPATLPAALSIAPPPATL